MVPTSRRGSAGGYHLTRPPEDITVGDVLRAVEGAAAPFETQRRGGRSTERHDLAELWDEISNAVSKVVDQLTFGDLAARALDRDFRDAGRQRARVVDEGEAEAAAVALLAPVGHLDDVLHDRLRALVVGERV